MVKGDGDVVFLAGAEHLEAELAGLGGVGHHAAQTGSDPGLTILVGGLGDHGTELSVIIDLELHGQVGLRLAIGIHHGECGLGGLAVVVHHVDFGIVGTAADDFLGTIVVAEDARMQ